MVLCARIGDLLVDSSLLISRRGSPQGQKPSSLYKGAMLKNMVVVCEHAFVRRCNSRVVSYLDLESRGPGSNPVSVLILSHRITCLWMRPVGHIVYLVYITLTVSAV